MCAPCAAFDGLRNPCNPRRNLIALSTDCYRLVPELEELDTTSSRSDSSPSDGEDEDNRSITPQNVHLQPVARLEGALSLNSSEDDEIGDGLRTTYHHHTGTTELDQIYRASECHGHQTPPQYDSPVNGGCKTPTAATGPVERRRRKLPEIPKNKKRK